MLSSGTPSALVSTSILTTGSFTRRKNGLGLYTPEYIMSSLLFDLHASHSFNLMIDFCWHLTIIQRKLRLKYSKKLRKKGDIKWT